MYKLHNHNIKRVIIKIGSSLLIKQDGAVDRKLINSVAKQIKALRSDGLEIVLVTSGAIGCGVRLLGQNRQNLTLPQSQAAAAVGQSRLMHVYDAVFGRLNMITAQILITREDVQSETRYLNAYHTMSELLKQNVVPIVNENDTVAVDEIKFGDNDALAAIIANLVQADLLIILSETDGLRDYTNNCRISCVTKIDNNIEALVQPQKTELGTGGMKSKIDAAKIVCEKGKMMIIAQGRLKNVLLKLIKGDDIGTVFFNAN